MSGLAFWLTKELVPRSCVSTADFEFTCTLYFCFLVIVTFGQVRNNVLRDGLSHGIAIRKEGAGRSNHVSCLLISISKFAYLLILFAVFILALAAFHLIERY